MSLRWHVARGGSRERGLGSRTALLRAHEPAGSFGLGPFLIADGKFLILDDRGVLTLADAGAGEFRILDRARILAGRDAWGPMALADGRLLARDSKTMVCVDLRAGQDG